MKTPFPFYKQPDPKDCGPTCLRIVATHYGKRNTVRHLMGVASKGDSAYTRQALDDWYIPKEKNYSVFASKYPLNGELKRQEEIIKKMEAWCEAEQITHTPTIFINGHELPEGYTVEDLKYVLV